MEDSKVRGLMYGRGEWRGRLGVARIGFKQSCFKFVSVCFSLVAVGELLKTLFCHCKYQLVLQYMATIICAFIRSHLFKKINK